MNKIISLAFLVFVVYNFLNMRGLKGEIGVLTDKNSELSGNLSNTKSELVQAQADLETLKTDLVTAQQENEKRKAEVDHEVMREEHPPEHRDVAQQRDPLGRGGCARQHEVLQARLECVQRVDGNLGREFGSNAADNHVGCHRWFAHPSPSCSCRGSLPVPPHLGSLARRVS